MEEIDIFTPAERILSLKMMSYWSNFAKYGYVIISLSRHTAQQLYIFLNSLVRTTVAPPAKDDDVTQKDFQW